MADAFRTCADSVSAPATRTGAIIPSDTQDLADIPKSIFIGTGGNIVLVGLNDPAGSTGTLFKNLPTPSRLDVRARRILATGTTATDIVGLY